MDGEQSNAGREGMYSGERAERERAEPISHRVDSPGRAGTDALLVSAGTGALAGMIAGLAWGGVGGRIAMRVVLLSSDDRVRGLTSDDGFEIGRISPETIFLLIFTAILGAVAGAFYGVIRILVAAPRRLMLLAAGPAAAAFGGSVIVHPDGIDFRLLEPLWLTVGLFVLIPGMWAVTVVFLTERLLRPGGLFRSTPAGIHHQFGGLFGRLAGWTFLVFIATLGVIGLISDVSDLCSSGGISPSPC